MAVLFQVRQCTLVSLSARNIVADMLIEQVGKIIQHACLELASALSASTL